MTKNFWEWLGEFLKWSVTKWYEVATTELSTFLFIFPILWNRLTMCMYEDFLRGLFMTLYDK